MQTMKETRVTKDAEFAAALEHANARKRAPSSRRRNAVPQPVMGVSVDLNLTVAELATLSPAQVEAVFEGVGKLTAATVAKGETPA